MQAVYALMDYPSIFPCGDTMFCQYLHNSLESLAFLGAIPDLQAIMTSVSSWVTVVKPHCLVLNIKECWCIHWAKF